VQGAKETDVQVEVLLIYRGWLSAVGFGTEQNKKGAKLRGEMTQKSSLSAARP
jgi:hypothetical protein